MPAVEVQPGTEIRGYRLERLLAHGGMAAVYAATHVALGRRAAVKVLSHSLSQDPVYVKRLLREARIVNEVRHPNIIDIFDFCEVESPRCVACIMELVDGPSLDQVLRGGPLRLEAALNAALQLASALEAVHLRGVIHRDLKPHNVMVTADPASALSIIPAVKLLDFGIAKMPTVEEAPLTTQTGVVLGTPAYMAPEQISGAGVEPATDLYALAELLFEMLTGRRVFEGPLPAVMRAKLTGSFKVELPASTPSASELGHLLRACLATMPDERPPLADFAAALRSLGQDLGLELCADPPLEDPDAATLLELPAFTLPTPEPEEPDAPSTQSSSGGSATRIFLERILEDFREAPAEPPPPVAPAEVPPAPALARVLVKEVPRAPPREIAQPLLTLAREPQPAVPRGRPPVPRIREGRRSWALPVLLGLLALLAVGTAVRWRAAAPGPASQARLEAAREQWHGELGPAQPPVEQLLREAREAQSRDVEEGYAAADRALRRALVVELDRPEALAAFAENRLLWREEDEGGLLAACVARAAELAPEAPAVLRAAAELALSRGERPAAQELLARAAARGEGDPLLALSRVRLLEDPEQVLARLSDPSLARLPRAQRLRAEALRRQGRLRSAVESLAERRKTGDARLLLFLAELELAAGEHARALSTAAAAGGRGGADGRVTLFEARAQQARGEVQLAAAALRRLAEDARQPARQRAAALGQQARWALDRGDLSSARAYARAAQELDAGEPTATVGRAEVQLLEGAEREALAASEAALEAGAEVLGLRMVAAAAAALVGEGARAASHLAEARRAVPESFAVAAMRAAAVALSGDEAGAREARAALLALDPRLDAEDDRQRARSPAALRALGHGLLRASTTRRAGAGAGELGELLLVLGGEGQRPAPRALAQAPLLHLLAGHNAVAAGRLAEAERGLNGVGREAGPSAHLLLGRILELKGERARAESAYAELSQGTGELPLARVDGVRLRWRRSPRATQGDVELVARALFHLAPARRLAWEAGL